MANHCVDCGKEVKGHGVRCQPCAVKNAAIARRKRVVLTCKQCGKSYSVKASRVPKSSFCSRKCYGAWRSEHMRGENNPHWKPKIKVICKQCDVEFEVRPSRIKNGHGKFCSKKCMADWMSQNMSGSNSPIWKSEFVECPICHEQFSRAPWEVRDGRGLFCSEKCYGIWRSENIYGESHPGWKGDDETHTCPVCGKTFLVRPTEKGRSRKCCSPECAHEFRAATARGENHYNWQGGPEERVCQWCGETFLIDNGSPQKFCSQTCYGKWRSENLYGENSPLWRGGKPSDPYPPEFSNYLKRKIRKRDHYACAICRLRGTSVHHIDYDKSNNDPLNLIILCKSCHGVTNYNRPYWQAELSKLQAIRQVPLPLGLMRSYTELSL